jgi:tetratricopeptide (TPR) repeat protein
MDADDWLFGTPDFSSLCAPGYFMKFGKDFTYFRQQLFRDDLPWRYEGVLHEYPTCGRQVEVVRLEGDYYIDSRRLGARNQDPKKYLKDAAILEEALKEEPENARYWFYLGQSYFDAGEFSKAIEAYSRRVKLGGWAEEVYYSQYRVGMGMIRRGDPDAAVIGALVSAFQLRPSRAESLHALAFHLRQKKQFDTAAMFAHAAARIALPSDVLFVDAPVYQYKALDELAVCGYYSPIYRQDGYNACVQLSMCDDLPPDVAERTKSNLKFYQDSLGFK